ncbi:MAG TPA: FCD domain-containing protein [Solirubrobacteraceae bacterium]|nr:FCD domain-containing protein [Solirubrobacteraceae bacterium]
MISVSASASETRAVPGYKSVQLQVRAYAREAGLQAGDRLPPERQLARLLGVSRNSLREALMVLRVEGLVDIQHGNGAYLARSVDDVVPPIAAEVRIRHPQLPAVGEVRNGLEALAAQLAAGRRDDHDLEAMVTAIRRMQDEIAGGGSGLEGDRRFHGAILEAARNPVLADLLASISEGSAQIATASLDRPGQPPRSLAAHRLIFEAIVAREPELSRRLMHEHLELTGLISPAPSA